jgi:predicted dehydrogenase
MENTAVSKAEPVIRVGIIGLNPQRGWAIDAHVPALRELSGYRLTALCTSRIESARAAATQLGIEHYFADPQELAQCDDVDLVVVTVKVPEHGRLVRAALDAGKHVYCEWPLAMDLAEARELAQLADQKGVRHVIGLQSREAPVIRYLRHLLADGYIGQLRSSSVIASGMAWGPYIDHGNAYILDQRHAVTMKTVPFGHFIDTFVHCLGEFSQLSADEANFYTQATVVDTGEVRPKTSSDQLLVQGRLRNGASASIHYRGSVSRASNFHWEINGSDGDLLLTSGMGQMQLADITLQGGRGQDQGLQPLAVPAVFQRPGMPSGYAANVYGVYAKLIESLRGSGPAPADFHDAVRAHQLLAAVDQSVRDRALCSL